MPAKAESGPRNFSGNFLIHLTKIGKNVRQTCYLLHCLHGLSLVLSSAPPNLLAYIFNFKLHYFNPSFSIPLIFCGRSIQDITMPELSFLS